MRKINIIGILIVAIAVIFASCSKSDSISSGDDAISSKATVSFDLSLTTPSLKSTTKSESGISPEEFFADPTILEWCDLSQIVYVYVEVLKKEKDSEGDYQSWEEFILNVQQFEGGEDIATDLIEFPDPEDYDYRISKFVALDAEGTPIMATPMSGSVYADYLDPEYQLYFDIDPTLYDKTRVDMQVLCFEKPMAPEFGFQWFDIEIKTANWMCMFVNICDESSAAEYHQVLDYYAEIYVSDSKGNMSTEEPYFKGYNYDTESNDVDPEIFCFPLPGTGFYENGIIIMLYDEEGGELIRRVNLAKETTDLYDYPAGAEMEEYFHLEIDCDKDIYSSSFTRNGSSTTIYKVDIYEAGGTATFTKLSVIEDNFHGHIAQHPGTGILYLLDNREATDEIRVVDEFTGSEIGRFTHDTSQRNIVPDDFPQLAWGPVNNTILDIEDDYVLWAGDAQDNKVYKIELNTEDGTFKYTGGDKDGFGISGGDLVAQTTASGMVSFTNNYSSGQPAVIAFNGGIYGDGGKEVLAFISASSDVTIGELPKFNGAAAWGDKYVMTTMQDNTALLWNFETMTVIELSIEGDYVEQSPAWGDMASRYFLNSDYVPQIINGDG